MEILCFPLKLNLFYNLEEIERKLNFSALSQFLTYAYTIDGQTLFQNIHELLPGQKLVFSFGDRTFKISEYWKLNLHPSNDSESLIKEKLEKYLKKSIKLRLESDAPVGALLSGGLDSSIMVAMLSEITNEPVKTFTTGFGHELDEYREAKIVAGSL